MCRDEVEVLRTRHASEALGERRLLYIGTRKLMALIFYNDYLRSPYALPDFYSSLVLPFIDVSRLLCRLCKSMAKYNRNSHTGFFAQPSVACFAQRYLPQTCPGIVQARLSEVVKVAQKLATLLNARGTSADGCTQST